MGVLIRSYGAPNGAEGNLWLSVMMLFGPHLCKSEITWAIIVNAILGIDIKSTIRLLFLA